MKTGCQLAYGENQLQYLLYIRSGDKGRPRCTHGATSSAFPLHLIWNCASCSPTRLCHNFGPVACLIDLFCVALTHTTFGHVKVGLQPRNMSYGGNVEGYLLMLKGEEASIVYCILDEGILQYFSRMGGDLLGVVPLSGSKVDVFLLPPVEGQVANQFRVDAQPRTPSVRRRGDRKPVDEDKIVSITLAGSTREVTDQWAVSILNWNRYSWEEGQMVCSTKNEFRNLETIIQLSRENSLKDGVEPVVPVGVSPAVLPL